MKCPVCKGNEFNDHFYDSVTVTCQGCGVVLDKEILLMKEDEENS
jgi:transcription initiation factor TFIIIB Brf1 subunit/transcription initiation factor TFIIB